MGRRGGVKARNEIRGSVCIHPAEKKVVAWRCDVEVMSRPGMKLEGVSAFALLRKICDLEVRPNNQWPINNNQ